MSTFVALMAWSCGSPAGPTSTTASVSGRVLDVQANTGVAGVTVVFSDPSNAIVVGEVARAVTDGTGSYALSVAAGPYSLFVDGVYRGRALVHSGANRTDLLVHEGDCIARYGMIADGRTGRPVAGATVSLLGVVDTSRSDGSYRLDFGCGRRSSGTLFMSVTRTGYEDQAVVMGRGESFSSVVRQDVDLMPG